MANMFGGGGGDGGLGNMFNPAAMAKLHSHPKVGKYFQDPKFNSMITFCQQQPSLFFQLMEQDPRLMEVFSVLTGLDLGKMGKEGGAEEESHEGHDHGSEPHDYEKDRREAEERKK